MGKVEFGLSDVHYAILDEEKRTYGATTAIPGAVSLSIDPEGDTTKFYADNDAYAVFGTNAGYTGDLEIAQIPDGVYTALLGFIKSEGGELVETAASTEVHFGLSFRIETNYGKSVAFRYYNCTLARPSASHNTKQDSTDPDTKTLSLTFLPFTLADGTTVIKSHKELGTSEAATWVSTIELPTFATA